jgi:uncharacterized membrane protein YqjE
MSSAESSVEDVVFLKRFRMAEISSARAGPASDSSAGTTSDRSPRDVDRAAPRPSPDGVLEEISGALGSMRAQLEGFLELAALEARRAGLTLVSMVALGFVAAICMIGAWVSVLFALAMWAVSFGFRPISVAIVIALTNLVAGIGLVYVCVGMSRALLFSATRRQLAGQPCVAEPKQ